VQLNSYDTEYKNITELSFLDYEILNNKLYRDNSTNTLDIVKYILRTPLDVIDEILMHK